MIQIRQKQKKNDNKRNKENRRIHLRKQKKAKCYKLRQHGRSEVIKPSLSHKKIKQFMHQAHRQKKR